MFHVKAVTALTRAGAHSRFKRCSQRLRSTLTSTSQDNVSSRGGGAHRDSARSDCAGQPGRGGTDGATTPANEMSVDFEQTQEAYKSKDSLELLRSLVVFKLCSFDFLVDKNKEIMDLGKKILGQKAFDQFMKMTFYGQFVAGEDHMTIRPLIQKNQAFGVGSVLDYSVEEDISQEEAEQKEMSMKVLARTTERENIKRTNITGESLEPILTSTLMRLNVTNIWRPSSNASKHLLQFSEVLVKWRRFFSFLATQQGKDGVEALEQRLELKQLQDFMIKLGAKGDFHGWFSGSKEGSSGTIDMLDWNSLIDDRTNISDLLVVPNLELGELVPLLETFTVEEERQMERMLQRMDVLVKHAIENGVRLMVDAEQTYFQPAISKLTLEMQRIYNREKPVIFNTYQCYLKEAYDNVTMDVELSRREGWSFAAKLVRGAYMYQERERANEIGYEDPINPDYESTNIMYHRMNGLGLLPTENKVYFGQLLGMCDQISFPLGQAGFPVYKYVPYGPVNEVMPYLSRRAQENRGFMKGAQKERELLWQELKRRLASGELLYRPASVALLYLLEEVILLVTEVLQGNMQRSVFTHLNNVEACELQACFHIATCPVNDSKQKQTVSSLSAKLALVSPGKQCERSTDSEIVG
ncbi:Proline dehydrogenase 1, mitochondrial [Collichthys lucidus]|uniref:Proline dehydrogenase n=1 Tax=Collichthys lucidus TaxID=240159 RepID=A0A4U5UUN3_COLLU|nr:Proline dehydrogenase 1, mitochondrial [Collichthys lucidus]